MYFENSIDEELVYNIVNSKNENNDISYEIPIFFQDCSIPLTVKYVNNEIINNYKVSNVQALKYDGSLLKNAGINLADIEKEINFIVNIVTQDDVVHKTELNLKIPLKNENEIIYDKAIEKEENVNIKF